MTRPKPLPGRKSSARSIKRTEDPRLLTGLGAYTDDRQVARALHVAFRSSDQSHARIRQIDCGGARGARHRRRLYRRGSCAIWSSRLSPPRAWPTTTRRRSSRSRAARCAMSASRSSRRRPKPLSGRGRARTDRRSTTSRCRSLSIRKRRRGAGAPLLHEEAGTQRAGEPRIQARRCRCRDCRGAGARPRPLPHASQDRRSRWSRAPALPNMMPGGMR